MLKYPQYMLELYDIFTNNTMCPQNIHKYSETPKEPTQRHSLRIQNLNSKSRSIMPKANKLQKSNIFIGNMTIMIKIM